MRSFACLLSFFISYTPWCIYCQNYPAIGAHTVIADYATSTLTKFVTSTSILNQGQHLGTSYTVTPPGVSSFFGKIALKGCYHDGQLLPATQTFIDTFNVGFLAIGGYTVTFKVYQSSSSLSCIPIDSNSISFFHDVPIVESLSELELSTKTKVFPNPAQNELTILSIDNSAQSALFLDSSGQIVTQQELGRGRTVINLERLPPGVYFYFILNVEKKVLLSENIVISR